MNKWLLIPDECFTVGRLRLRGFRFITTEKTEDILGLLKTKVNNMVSKIHEVLQSDTSEKSSSVSSPEV